MRHEAKLTSKGQLTLPVKLRQALRLKPGDKVTFIEEPDGRFRLETKRYTLGDLLGTVRVDRKLKPGELDQWIAEARGARSGVALGPSALKDDDAA